jgi:DNA-binding winged helix-turn-helix (wHTH) protein/Tfp pilus assembly protein PilF
MTTATTVFRFGPFVVDAAARRVTRDGGAVRIADRHLDVLLLLLARAGTVVSKDALVDGAWRGIAVTDNSSEPAISALRRVLGPGPDGEPIIRTVPRQGYRLVADVERTIARASDDALDALLAPHRAWMEGRAALESLARDEVTRARGVFERVVAAAPDQASAHVGLANACVMQFEATRADVDRDVAALERAAHHAREACRLEPHYAEAWATLGFVLDKTGARDDAQAAGRLAIALEPDNWRHHLRLASISWGEARLRAAGRALALLPGHPLAHWLAATVHVARGALDEAERHVHAGIDEQRRLEEAPATFNGVGLEWLAGLLCLARGEEDKAMAAFERELSLERGGHLYARECCAHAWHAIGALHLRAGRRDEAAEAFRQAIARIAGHPLAHVGLAAAQRGDAASAGETAPTADASAPGGPTPFEVLLARSAALTLGDRRDEAAAVVERALASAPPGNAGWLVPLEPLLRVFSNPRPWTAVLARLRARAT